MDMLNGKCDKISDLVKRETERQLDLKKKKEDKKLFVAENEKLDYYDKEFTENRIEIERELNALSSLEISKLPEQFESISKKIAQLQQFVANSKIFLRVYDIKKYQEILNELHSRANSLEEQLVPKKKFSFKNRSKKVIKSLTVPLNLHNQKDTIDEIDSSSLIKSYLPVQTCGFENSSNKTLQLEKEQTFKKDIRLQNLSKCKVNILGNPSTIHMSKLDDCTILTGPVSTSIFADNCKNCTFVIACQQLRLHSSYNNEIYLHVTSRAIIEDCKDIAFASYNLVYDKIDLDFKESGLDIEQNNWTAIDDFNWLNVDKASPNWRLLNKAEYKTWHI